MRKKIGVNLAFFVPTLNEYVELNIGSPDSVIKTKVDDLCDFPGYDDCQSEAEEIKAKKRDFLC
ncbi:hypothetical protein [Pantoea ananatis]|uniref:hypothetical protein n=1 Tax=Pantoea ananas TaxID=553 RepID=UPI001B301969|nr:hypothetical protein [Pantoea ananatis]